MEPKSTAMQVADPYKISRILHIIQAALEYFIVLTISGSFLATLTSYLGLSDALTGILTAFVSLGSTFQLAALFLVNRRPVKRWVTTLLLLTQLCYLLVYLVPLFPMDKTVVTVLFSVFLLGGYVFNNVCCSARTTWNMGLVADHRRGVFTATKEMVSLLGSILFTYAMSTVIDNMKAEGNIRGALVVTATVIFVLALGFGFVTLLTKEKPEDLPSVSVKENLVNVFSNKTLFKVILLSVLVSVATNALTPFLGAYAIKEKSAGGLGYTLQAVTVIGAVASLCRMVVSRPFGKYADRRSFAKLLIICFGINIVAVGFNVFATPDTPWCYAVYVILYAVAMAGINSSAINLIYDYVVPEQRVSALALRGFFTGFIGFLTTLLMAIPVELLQKNGNTLFGITVYAPQALSVFSLLMLGIILWYLSFVVMKLPRPESK